MSGPLSRRRFSSDLLLEEDDEAIPWTYVSTQNDSSHGDVPTYTSEGVANKRRKLYRQRKDDLDVKPTSSRSRTESVELWTEVEDLSLCQAVSICLQHTSSESSLALTTENLSDLERNHPMSVFSRNVSRELQTLDISKCLAECFVPSHEHGDVLARVQSSAFRRTFMGFLNSKSRRGQSLLCTDAAESNNACNSSDSGAQFKHDLQQDLKSSPFIKPDIYPETFESDQGKHPSPSPSERNSRKKTERKSEKIDLNPGSSVELLDRQETDVLQGELATQEEGSEKFQETRRSSSRLRSKLRPEDRDTSTDNEDIPNLTRQIPQVSTDNSNDRNLSEKNLNVGPNSHPPAKTDKRKKRLPRNKQEVIQRKQSNEMVTETSCEPAKTGKIENREQEKRHEKTGSQFESAELEQPPSKVPAKMDTKCESEKPNKLTSENLPQVDTISRQLKESTSSEQEDTKASKSPLQLTPSGKAPLMATVRPLRKAQNEKDNEKRSFKKFRKKFLDRCLEVQHSGLGLTARIPGQGTNIISNVHSSLDEYLTMQHVQQSRKGILDACLMAQRDTS
ncbi:uncharacterized protein LOC119744261 [Patiria miniata]|uniref:Uncharacterized protein n=1 Tax=Patiria miniata TaxID=46514 RepID=A0A914BKQ5_PATMI|nr:uncharacterized protein LOC119744261 [Patiria miniata]XP_038076048.1 uncharacterized protein LOC119744261 [Patiria miniata]